MRGKSSKQRNFKGEIDNNLDSLKEEPHLSGAYIRSLVKHLASSRVKDPMNSLDSTLVLDGGDEFHPHRQNSTRIEEPQQPQPQPQPHKKQVRRRLHTTRPYQEQLLNMAEARREIVTALKLHRASMKQANENHTQPPHQQSQPSPEAQHESRPKSRRNSRIYASSSGPSFANNLDTMSYQSFPYQTPQSSYSWPMSAGVPPPIPENFNLLLPNQTLGLNLNLQDFNNLDTSFFQSNYSPSAYYSSSSLSTSSSPPLSGTTEDTSYMAISQAPLMTDSGEGDLGLHHAMDDEEMAEIRSLGEQHEIEWNDTVNLLTSAWWFKFLKSMETDSNVNTEENGFYPFNEVMEFPAWLNANESCLEQLDDHGCGDYFQNPALPCMDIEEIEGMDGEWLA